MSRAYFRVYAELNDFLLPDLRQATFAYDFEGTPSIKHALEAVGIPHPEVDLILVNGQSQGFSYLVRDGDRVSVYPHFTRIDIAPISLVRPPPLAEHRFILDNHLGRLAAYLRILGFDTLYQNDYQDEALAHVSNRQGRILLTRDRGLLMRSLVMYGYCIRAKDPREQVMEVLRRYDLFGAIKPFKHCLRCNGLLGPVAKEKILHRLEPKTRLYYEEFYICLECDQVYWKGSHYARMSRFVEAVLAEGNSAEHEGKYRGSIP